jgi:hypothetical protein
MKFLCNTRWQYPCNSTGIGCCGSARQERASGERGGSARPGRERAEDARRGSARCGGARRRTPSGPDRNPGLGNRKEPDCCLMLRR